MKLRDLYEATEWQQKQIDALSSVDVAHGKNLSTFVNTVEKIRRDCQPFIKVLKQVNGLNPAPEQINFLYRGVKAVFRNPLEAMLHSTHAKRDPLSSHYHVALILGELLKRQFGIDYRSNHILFASTDPNTALSYGDVMLVFPVSNFKYCWSTVISDFYESDFYYKIYDNYEEFYENYPHKKIPGDGNKHNINARVNFFLNSDSNESKAVFDSFKKSRYTDKGINNFFKDADDNEIMIHCKNYYSLAYTDEVHITDMIETLEIMNGNNDIGIPEKLKKLNPINLYKYLLYHALIGKIK